MDINIEIDSNKIKVSNDEGVIGEYVISEGVNLTPLVKEISKSDKEIAVSPEGLTDFNSDIISDTDFKLIEYIYSVLV